MKHKLLAVALALVASGVYAQNVRLAPVISVEPVQHREVISVPRRVCNTQTVPVYNSAPVYQTYRDPNSPAPIVGMIIGAVVGYHGVASAPGLGALAGGAVGYSVGDHVRSTHPYWTGQTVTNVTYHNRLYCQTHYETLEANRTIGYRVTYEIDGTQNTLVMTSHPGSHVRLVTRVEP